MLQNDVLYELMYFLSAKDLVNFRSSCQRFNDLVTEFERRKQGKTILQQWKYTNDILNANYQKGKINVNFHDFSIRHCLWETKEKGFTILLIRHDTVYQFYLLSFLTGDFYLIPHCKEWQFIFLFATHPIRNKSIFVCHGMFREGETHVEKSIIFNCADISNITINIFDQLNCIDSIDAVGIVNPVTRLHHCRICFEIYHDINICDIPETFCDFDKLPSRDRLYLKLDSDGYFLCREIEKTRTKLSIPWYARVNCFSDRYVLEFDQKQTFTVYNVLTNSQSFAILNDPQSLPPHPHEKILNISKIFGIKDKFYFSLDFSQTWFVLYKHSEQWQISLFKKTPHLSLPVFCQIEQRVVL